jgi:hypothetical protein
VGVACIQSRNDPGKGREHQVGPEFGFRGAQPPDMPRKELLPRKACSRAWRRKCANDMTHLSPSSAHPATEGDRAGQFHQRWRAPRSVGKNPQGSTALSPKDGRIWLYPSPRSGTTATEADGLFVPECRIRLGRRSPTHGLRQELGHPIGVRPRAKAPDRRRHAPRSKKQASLGTWSRA